MVQTKMKWEYDPPLLEEAVFLEMRRRETAGDLESYLAYRKRIDPLYGLPQQERDRSFNDAYAEFFSRLGFDRLLREVAEEYPLLSQEVSQVTFLKAQSRKQESAELFVKQSDDTTSRPQNTVAVRTCPESFLEPAALQSLLRHEFYHITDMLDPEFGYEPTLGVADLTRMQEDLIRDRYRALWDAYIEGRLARQNKGKEESFAQMEALFARAFQSLSQEGTLHLLEFVWNAEHLTHQELLALAKDPQGQRQDRPPEAASSMGRGQERSGLPCPLCRFPTYEWATPHEHLTEALERAIREVSPLWTPEQGACKQCVELFSSAHNAPDTHRQ